MIHIWNWILNFTGIHYGENKFSTHMYNFWSGFGGDITEFALIGTLITIYRHHDKGVVSLRKLIIGQEQARHDKTKNKD
jgi:hypothetical protein